jgi:hypothetical protein
VGRQQMTEMLKGTLEGIVLAILSARSAYGYEITARLRDQGFADTQGLFAQHAGTGISRGVLEHVELPHGTT